jgi:hypothetical protein
MVDSDDEYVQDDEYDEQGGAAGGSYGTRAKGSKKPTRQARKERWEGTIKKDFGSLTEGVDGSITESLEGMIEARKRKR